VYRLYGSHDIDVGSSEAEIATHIYVHFHSSPWWFAIHHYIIINY